MEPLSFRLAKAEVIVEEILRHTEETGICAALGPEAKPGLAVIAHIRADKCPFPLHPDYPLPWVLMVTVHPDDRDWLDGALQEATERAYRAKGASFMHGEANGQTTIVRAGDNN